MVAYLGGVDHDFGHSSLCLFLLGQMRISQNRLVNRTRWWNIKNQIERNQGQVRDHQSRPVFLLTAIIQLEVPRVSSGHWKMVYFCGLSV